MALASSLPLSKIPKEYRHLPLLGKGFTSVAYHDGEHALVLTRDKFKLLWMQEQMGGTVQGEFFTTKSRKPDYDSFPVFVVQCELMQPLDRLNRMMLENVFRDYNNTREDIIRDMNSRLSIFDSKEILAEVTAHYQERCDDYASYLNPVFSFISEWDCRNTDFLLERNWMQTKSGDMKCIDPVVDTSLLDIAWDIKPAPDIPAFTPHIAKKESLPQIKA